MTTARHTPDAATNDALGELYRHIPALEHIAEGSEQHLQLLVPALESVAGALERVLTACDVLDGDVSGLDPRALAGRRDAVARIRAALLGPTGEAPPTGAVTCPYTLLGDRDDQPNP